MWTDNPTLHVNAFLNFVRKDFHLANELVHVAVAIETAFSDTLFAVLACVAFFGLVPLALYGSWVIPRAVSAADLGGPLNFVIIPLAGALLGLAISAVVFLPLSLLAERFSFRRWWCTVVLLTFSLVAIVVVASVCFSRAGGQPTRWLPVLVCTGLAFYLVGGFLVYLCCIAVCRRVFP
jgi:hypothetical protein